MVSRPSVTQSMVAGRPLVPAAGAARTTVFGPTEAVEIILTAWSGSLTTVVEDAQWARSSALVRS